jgi:hypothetical protein
MRVAVPVFDRGSDTQVNSRFLIVGTMPMILGVLALIIAAALAYAAYRLINQA